MEMPQCFSSASKAARPFAMFSSFFSFLNHWRILLRASLQDSPVAIFIQSRLGPLAFLEVRISTMSPFFSTWSSVTIRPFTLAPTIRLPTAEWMA